jgi:hypothetical protein
MDEHARERLTVVMAQLAAGDDAAVAALYLEFGATVRASLAAIARARGRRIPADDLDGLTIDACLALRRVARGWRPDGSLPWTWARNRLVALVDAYVAPGSHPVVDFDDLEAAAPSPTTAVGDVDDDDPLDLLAILAESNQRLGLLADALNKAVPPGEGRTLLRYALQHRAGDPSPSHTVAAQLGLRPPAVRQRVSRARRRLADVVANDPRYAPLTDIALLSGPAASARTPERAA